MKILGTKKISKRPQMEKFLYIHVFLGGAFASFHFQITPKCSNVHRRVHMNKSTHGEAPGISMKFIDLVGSFNPT